MYSFFKKCRVIILVCIYFHTSDAGILSSRTLRAPTNASTVVIVGVEQATQASNMHITLLLQCLKAKKRFTQKIPCIVELPPLSPSNKDQYEKNASNVVFKRLAQVIKKKKAHHIFS